MCTRLEHVIDLTDENEITGDSDVEISKEKDTVSILIDELYRTCSDLEHAEDMTKIIDGVFMLHFKNADTKYVKSKQFQRALRTTITLLNTNPSHKFSHVSYLCNILQRNKRKGHNSKKKQTESGAISTTDVICIVDDTENIAQSQNDEGGCGESNAENLGRRKNIQDAEPLHTQDTSANRLSNVNNRTKSSEGNAKGKDLDVDTNTNIHDDVISNTIICGSINENVKSLNENARGNHHAIDKGTNIQDTEPLQLHNQDTSANRLSYVNNRIKLSEENAKGNDLDVDTKTINSTIICGSINENVKSLNKNACGNRHAIDKETNIQEIETKNTNTIRCCINNKTIQKSARENQLDINKNTNINDKGSINTNNTLYVHKNANTNLQNGLEENRLSYINEDAVKKIKEINGERNRKRKSSCISMVSQVAPCVAVMSPDKENTKSAADSQRDEGSKRVSSVGDGVSQSCTENNKVLLHNNNRNVNKQYYANELEPNLQFHIKKEKYTQENVAERSTIAQENIMDVQMKTEHENENEENEYLMPYKCKYIQDLKKMIEIEKSIAKYSKYVRQLEEEVVTADDESSPYIRCEKYKDKIVSLYKELCKLSGSRAIQRKRVCLTKLEGHPKGPLRRLETFINNNIKSSGVINFPDFQDVITCVALSNVEDKLGLNRSQVKHEARILFKQCGVMLQKLRKWREWKFLMDRVQNETSWNDTNDPAEHDPQLQARLEANRNEARRKETRILERFSTIQSRKMRALTTRTEMEPSVRRVNPVMLRKLTNRSSPRNKKSDEKHSFEEYTDTSTSVYAKSTFECREVMEKELKIGNKGMQIVETKMIITDREKIKSSMTSLDEENAASSSKDNTSMSEDRVISLLNKLGGNCRVTITDISD